MAGLSLIDVDLGKAAVPVVVIAAVGVGGYFLWKAYTNSQQQAASNAAEAQASPLEAYQQAADLALLQSFTGGSSTNETSTNAQGSVTNTGASLSSGSGIIQNGTVYSNPDLASLSAPTGGYTLNLPSQSVTNLTPGATTVTASTQTATASQSIANAGASTTSNGI